VSLMTKIPDMDRVKTKSAKFVRPSPCQQFDNDEMKTKEDQEFCGKQNSSEIDGRNGVLSAPRSYLPQVRPCASDAQTREECDEWLKMPGRGERHPGATNKIEVAEKRGDSLEHAERPRDAQRRGNS